MRWSKGSGVSGVDPSRTDPWSLPAYRSKGSGVRRRPAAPELGSDEDRLFAAFLSAERLIELPTPLAAIRLSLELLRHLIPSEVAFGSLYDIDEDVLRIVAMHPAVVPRSQNGSTLSTDRGLVARALAALDPPLRLVDGGEGGQLVAVDGERIVSIRSAMYMPLRHEGRLLGLVHMVNRAGSGFTAGDAGVLGYLGDRLAETIHTTRCSL